MVKYHIFDIENSLFNVDFNEWFLGIHEGAVNLEVAKQGLSFVQKGEL